MDAKDWLELEEYLKKNPSTYKINFPYLHTVSTYL